MADSSGLSVGLRRGVVGRAAPVLPTIRTMHSRGTSWREIAERLAVEWVNSP